MVSKEKEKQKLPYGINEEGIKSASDPVPGAEITIEQEPVGYLPEEGFEKRGEGKVDDQNSMPLVTIKLTLYCRIVPHQVPLASTRATGNKGGFAVGGFSLA